MNVKDVLFMLCIIPSSILRYAIIDMIMKKNAVYLNMISGIILQVLNIFSAFIIPKIILSYFGSEVNGLGGSLNQFLGYASLLEGGVTGVLIASLYKPLRNGDNQRLSSIVKTAKRFYFKISLMILIYSVVISIAYPFIFSVSFPKSYVITLSLLLALNNLIQYSTVLTFKSIITADGKIYVVSLTQCLITILNIIFAFVTVIVYPSIHLLKLFSALLMIIQPLVFRYYVNKHYSISKDADYNDDFLKNRWNGFSINVATFIHFSTDITILTIFTDLYVVSIYNVYSLVVSGVEAIVSTLCTSITPVIGRTYASGDIEKTSEKFDAFESLNFFVLFVLFSCTLVLITPFVMIYTKNITDTNYYQPLFGMLLVISKIVYLIKVPHFELACAANLFKEMTIQAFIEALINIVVSVILVSKFGLIGVAIGTICAMTFRMIYQVNLTSKTISRRSILFYKKLLVYSLVMVLFYLLFSLFIKELNVLTFIISGFICATFALVIYYLVSKYILKIDIISELKKVKM